MKALDYKLQNYVWGPTGTQSYVGQLAAHAAEIIESTHYAELWVGCHPNGPSSLKCSSKSNLSLEQYLKRPLSFLFKVLHVNSPLSIQIHPCKYLAQQLHSSFPQVYPDSNDKPEMLIALTPFRCMAGFKDVESVQSLIESLPPLTNIFSSHTPLKPSDVTSVFVSLFQLDKTILDQCISSLHSYLDSPKLSPHTRTALELFVSLHRSFPNDPAVLSPFFLQIWDLLPHEALFLPSECIHGYLSGCCIEIMKPSDNVIRAGLTPKKIDAQAMSSVLLTHDVPSPVFYPLPKDSVSVLELLPPTEHRVFKLYLIKLSEGESYQVELEPGVAKILLVLSGSGVVNHDDVMMGNAFVSLESCFDVVGGSAGLELSLVCETV
ncbi:hypothetical protein GEMRC1_008497 [Eukaryota sp. GEM-RC1]